MSKIAIEGNASGTGTFTIASPNSNSSRTLSLPDGTGTFVVNGINSSIVSGTVVASTSGTSIDFNGIPSWVKRITVMFSGVSTNGSSIIQVQIGTSGGIQNTGYASGAWLANTSNSNSTTGFIVSGTMSAAYAFDGNLTLALLNSATGLWSFNSVLSGSTAGINSIGAGSKTLSGTLDRVRITTVNGTDTFDAGSINILYE